jgi:hypothetical protein
MFNYYISDIIIKNNETLKRDFIYIKIYFKKNDRRNNTFFLRNISLYEIGKEEFPITYSFTPGDDKVNYTLDNTKNSSLIELNIYDFNKDSKNSVIKDESIYDSELENTSTFKDKIFILSLETSSNFIDFVPVVFGDLNKIYSFYIKSIIDYVIENKEKSFEYIVYLKTFIYKLKLWNYYSYNRSNVNLEGDNFSKNKRYFYEDYKILNNFIGDFKEIYFDSFYLYGIKNNSVLIGSELKNRYLVSSNIDYTKKLVKDFRYSKYYGKRDISKNLYAYKALSIINKYYYNSDIENENLKVIKSELYNFLFY